MLSAFPNLSFLEHKVVEDKSFVPDMVMSDGEWNIAGIALYGYRDNSEIILCS